IRDGKLQTHDIKVLAKRVDVAQILFTMMAPLIFWLMGTVVVIFLRPRDERWLVLVLFSYDTALWIASGLAGRTGGSAYVFHAVIWFFLPLTFHLHTILPNELFPARVRRGLQALLYGIAGVLAVLDARLLLQGVGNLSIWFTLAGVRVSVAFLLLRLVLPLEPATKIAARIMTFGVTLGLLPFLLFYGVFLVWFKHMALAGRDMSPFSPYMTGIAAVSVPIVPMAYVYSIYKHRLRTVEFRA